MTVLAGQEDKEDKKETKEKKEKTENKDGEKAQKHKNGDPWGGGEELRTARPTDPGRPH